MTRSARKVRLDSERWIRSYYMEYHAWYSWIGNLLIFDFLAVLTLLTVLIWISAEGHRKVRLP